MEQTNTVYIIKLRFQFQLNKQVTKKVPCFPVCKIFLLLKDKNK